MKNLLKVWIFFLGAIMITACSPTELQSPTKAVTETVTPTQALPSDTQTTSTPETPSVDFLNLTYNIDGIDVTLVDGRSEVEAAPGSSTKILKQYYGNDALGDLNGDGVQDVTFVLTQNSGGSGTLFYVVAALSTKDGYVGSNGILLGDRIAPQSTSISGNLVTVAYADRKPDEPFSAEPTVGMSKTLQVIDNQLVVVSQP
jgi:hypothetical protein